MQGNMKDPMGWGTSDPFGVKKGRRNKRLGIFTPKVERAVDELPERIGSGVVGLGKKLTLGPLFHPRRSRAKRRRPEEVGSEDVSMEEAGF